MDRKSIFEILESDLDYAEEIKKMEYLFRVKGRDYSIYEIVQGNYLNWQHRNTTIDVFSLYKALGFIEIFQMPFDFSISITQEMFLRYCEMMSNLLYMYYDAPDFDRDDEKNKKASSILENIKTGLGKLGYHAFVVKGEKKIIVVQDNCAATLAAELVDVANSKRIMEYNRYLLQGDLARKKDILKNLADLFEGKRKQLDANNAKSLSDDIGFLLNSLDIRHNNREGKNKNTYLRQLTTKDLEEWYDKTYSLIVAAIITIERIEIGKDVALLKAAVEKAKKETR